DEVLDGDQTDKLVVLVHDGQLLHLVGGQQLQCVLLGHALLGHDQRHRGHDIGDQAVGVRLETHVAVGAQTQQGAVLVHHGKAGDTETGAEVVHLFDGHVGGAGDRVGNHARLGTLDQFDVFSLLLGGEVAVEHTEATLACHGDRRAGLGEGVHCGGNNRGAQSDVAGDLGGGVNIGRHDIGCVGQKKYIIEGQSDECYLVRIVSAGGNSALGGHFATIPPHLVSTII